MTNNADILDFQDPGTLSDELLDAPGFINELTDWTLTQSPSPNRSLAFIGALSMLSHLTGRSYADDQGTHTNIYCIALGETGIGKEAPRRTNMLLAASVGASRTLCDALASGEALEELLARQPNVFLQVDEIEGLFADMRANSRISRGLNERMRRLYSASASFYNLRATTKAPDGLTVAFPHVTLFGTGTPGAFYKTLDEKAFDNGLLGRCLIFRIRDDYKSNRPRQQALPDSILEAATNLFDCEREGQKSGILTQKTVDATPEANDALRQAADFSVNLRRELAERNLPTARALIVRMVENITKLAMLRAISANIKQPIMTKEDVLWAAQVVTLTTKSMLYEAQFHLAEGKFDALLKRFVSILTRNGGSLTRRDLIRSLHVDLPTFKRIVATLQASDDLMEETEFGKSPTYTLKRMN